MENFVNGVLRRVDASLDEVYLGKLEDKEMLDIKETLEKSLKDGIKFPDGRFKTDKGIPIYLNIDLDFSFDLLTLILKANLKNIDGEMLKLFGFKKYLDI